MDHEWAYIVIVALLVLVICVMAPVVYGPDVNCALTAPALGSGSQQETKGPSP